MPTRTIVTASCRFARWTLTCRYPEHVRCSGREGLDPASDYLALLPTAGEVRRSNQSPARVDDHASRVQAGCQTGAEASRPSSNRSAPSALWQRYSNAAAQLLKAGGPEKAAALERLRRHAAQIKAIAG
jgi:hypothetical protein